MIETEGNIYMMVIELGKEGLDTEEARERLHREVDLICDGIQYPDENDESEDDDE